MASEDYDEYDLDSDRPTVDLRWLDEARRKRSEGAEACAEPGRFAKEQTSRGFRTVAEKMRDGQLIVAARGGNGAYREGYEDPGAKAIFTLGRDVHGRCHVIEVSLARLPDGTLGVRVDGGARNLSICPSSSNSFTMTTHRPDRMPTAFKDEGPTVESYEGPV